MYEELKIEELNMEPFKCMQFKEYLGFVLSSKKSLSFVDFQKHCGVSRPQWDMFKANNREVEDFIFLLD
ncbi:MAG: hypothetical protein U9R08_04035 [Nanoarchaeota archaeon]|nr:hypothetical protein [Nanoarchaeota archaeon]